MKEPVGGLIVTAVPNGTFFRERLKAVSRMRVANIKSTSNGELAIEKVRAFETAFYRFMEASHPQIGESIINKRELDSVNEELLKKAIQF